MCREILYNVIKKYNIRSILDAPCGSFHWMQHVVQNATAEKGPTFKYHGIDIVESVINKSKAIHSQVHPNWKFSLVDITSQPVPQGYDLIFSRDALQHLPLLKVINALENFAKSNAKFLLVGSYEHNKLNRNINVGDVFYINLFIAPFNLSNHIEIYEEIEDTESMKHLVLYDIEKHLKNADFNKMRENSE